jgi:hypothetical protein
MMRAILIAAAALTLTALSACAHRELKAPCSASTDWFDSSAYADTCGPMLPVNQEAPSGNDH